MLIEHRALGNCLFEATYHLLSRASREFGPFNHVQLNFFYTKFNSMINWHQDVGEVDGNSVMTTPSQLLNSSVVVYVDGDVEMLFKLLHIPPEFKQTGRHKTRSFCEYVFDPKLVVRLGKGAVFVLSPEDDRYYHHMALFERGLNKLESRVRIAYVRSSTTAVVDGRHDVDLSCCWPSMPGVSPARARPDLLREVETAHPDRRDAEEDAAARAE